MTQEKMELLSELWRCNVRAEADFSNEYHQVKDVPKPRFVVTFKKSVYVNSRKVKVYDNETKNSSDEPRDTVVMHIKSRIAAGGGKSGPLS